MNDVGLTDLVKYEGQMLLSLGPPSDFGSRRCAVGARGALDRGQRVQSLKMPADNKSLQLTPKVPSSSFSIVP